MIASVSISSDAPFFKKKLVVISVHVGVNVSLSCDADGLPNPHLTWTCDGARERETTNHLHISQIKNSVRCKCTASNYLHSETKEFSILVLKPSTAVPPAAISTPEAAAQSGTAHLSFWHFRFCSFYTENESD